MRFWGTCSKVTGKVSLQMSCVVQSPFLRWVEIGLWHEVNPNATLGYHGWETARLLLILTTVHDEPIPQAGPLAIAGPAAKLFQPCSAASVARFARAYCADRSSTSYCTGLTTVNPPRSPGEASADGRLTDTCLVDCMVGPARASYSDLFTEANDRWPSRQSARLFRH